MDDLLAAVGGRAVRSALHVLPANPRWLYSSWSYMLRRSCVNLGFDLCGTCHICRSMLRRMCDAGCRGFSTIRSRLGSLGVGVFCVTAHRTRKRKATNQNEKCSHASDFIFKCGLNGSPGGGGKLFGLP